MTYEEYQHLKFDLKPGTPSKSPLTALADPSKVLGFLVVQ